MKNQTYETYYNDGGHGGPHKDFLTAYTYSLRIIRGSATTSVEIRPVSSQAIGGYSTKNSESFYAKKP